jgi:exosortase H (IPTLxxWG-CTERM-specific)
MPSADRGERPRPSGRRVRAENRPALLFCLLFALFLGVGYFLSIFRPVVEHGIDPFTAFIARAAGAIFGLLGASAEASGTRLGGGGVAFELRNGCNGVWATIIFLSAVLAFPSPVLAKVWGAVAGFCAIFCINLIRVISLYYIVLYFPNAFEGAHIYVWQSVVIASSVLLWLAWAQRATRPRPVRARR